MDSGYSGKIFPQFLPRRYGAHTALLPADEDGVPLHRHEVHDEARARLVLRWEELERGRLTPVPSPAGEGGTELMTLTQQRQVLRLADQIIGEGLRMMNEAAEDTLTATQVAKTFNMTVFDFNAVLRDMGILYRRRVCGS